MILLRCPSCGRRLREGQLCAVHGAQGARQEAVEPGGAGDDAFRASLLALGYRVTSVLGRGGFSTVYAAERVSDRRRVAVKVALPEQVEGAGRLAAEAAALTAVGPPHVPAVYARGQVGHHAYLVLEAITAPTLAAQMTTSDALSLSRFGAWADAMLSAVDAIHARGIVHLDLKPENIFLAEARAGTRERNDAEARAGTRERNDAEAREDDAWRATIIDFGLARAERTQLVRSAADDAGTAEYMSPEQCEGRFDIDRRSDIYSVGVMLYELLAGAPPFWGAGADVREAQRSRRPAPLPRARCPAELEQVIRRCLAKDRARRFDHVLALRAALETALASSSGARAQASPSAGSVPPNRVPSGRAPARPAASPEKRTVGLLFFEAHAGLAKVRPLLAATGGEIAQAQGAHYVAAFGHDLADNPAQSAMHAAERLQAEGIAQRVVVDVAQVAVQLRPDGSRRFFGPALARKDRFPAPSEPLGVLLTSAAHEVLPQLEVVPVAGRADRFAFVRTLSAGDVTQVGAQLHPLLGRVQLVGELVASAQRALLEHAPSLTTVVGEPGYGRSHLATVLARELEVRLAASVLRVTAQPAIVGALSQTLGQLLRAALVLPLEPPADGGEEFWSAQLGELAHELWAAASFMLGWIDAEHADVRRIAAAPGALRRAAARTVGEVLRRRALRRPLVLLLDDAHLADEAALDAIEYATLKEAGAPLWACVLVRPNFERARPSWGSRAAYAGTFPLTPLAHADAIELARTLLWPVEHVPPAVLARLAARTQGSPRLLVELVRGLKRDGFVRRSERGLGYYLATDELERLPDLPIVQWNARRELEALPPALAAHARLAAVLGVSFTADELEQLISLLERSERVDDAPLDARVALERLIDAGVLIRHRDGWIEFRHALLRDVVYELVPEARRRALHRAAFELYQTIELPIERRLPRLAWHAERASENRAAAQAYLELAGRALSAHAYLEAEAAFGSALAQLPADDPRTIEALRGRGLMRFRIGRHEDALKDLRSARQRAAAEGQDQRELELALDEATVLDWTLDYGPSAELVRTVEARVYARERSDAEARVYARERSEVEALTRGAERVPDSLSARLVLGLARIHHRRGEAGECVRLGLEAIERARALGDAGYETREIALLMVSADAALLGNYEQAERCAGMAIAEAQAHADQHHLGAAYNNRALLWYERSDVPHLLQDLDRSRELARELGDPLLEYGPTCNLAEVGYAIAELDMAREHAERAFSLVRQLFGEGRELSARELLLARIALYRGDLAEARALTRRIRARCAELRARAAEDAELPPAEASSLELVELAAGEASEAEWEAFSARTRELDLPPFEQMELLEVRARAALRAGRFARGRELLVEALALSERKPNLLSGRIARTLARVSSDT